MLSSKHTFGDCQSEDEQAVKAQRPGVGPKTRDGKILIRNTISYSLCVCKSSPISDCPVVALRHVLPSCPRALPFVEISQLKISLGNCI